MRIVAKMRKAGVALASTIALVAPLALRPPVAPARAAGDGDEKITPQLMRAVERGLSYLAGAQQHDGSWLGDVGFKLNQQYEVREPQVPHVGVTALCGMAFLAGGHLPDRGPYGKVLDKAITFLLSQVNDQGFITAHHTRMYDHAFATLFFAEVFGQTARTDVRARLQQAVDLIVNSQNEHGSWRYEPFALESDMSITVCQLMALRSARNVGIKVPMSTIDRAVKYVEDSQVKKSDPWELDSMPAGIGYYVLGPGAFRYQDETGDMSRSSFALTAAGITSLYHAGRYDHEALRQSLKFLEQTLPIVSESTWRDHYFYWYGHYYAVQAMFITGDPAGHPYWTLYWRHISNELLDGDPNYGQQRDGSWPNDMGPGKNFGTAVALIVLQTPYRYLPILQR